MPYKKKQERNNRMRVVAELYLKGWFQYDIAKHVGVTQQQVSYDLKCVYRMWRQSAIKDFDQLQERELVKIDHLEQTYWNAWQKSVEKYEKNSKEYYGKKKILVKTKTDEMFQFGDPRYLNGVQWCINKRCEILGINAPIKTKEMSEDSVITFQFGGTGLSQEELEKPKESK
jgi:predicted transcriptional regulator